MFKSILTALLVSMMVLAACNKSSKNKGAGNEIAGKPLPTDCADLVDYSIQWSNGEDAYSFTVNVGLKEHDYEKSFILDGSAKEFKHSLERGLEYFVQIDKTNVQNEHAYRTFKFSIPSCEDRQSYKAAHPEYEEPRLDVVDWSKPQN